MVRPVDIVMAEGTASPQEPPVRSGIAGPSGEGRGGVTVFVVALLAQPRLPDPEQPDVVAPVGLVAVQATLADGGVLPQKRPPLVRVAAVTVLVDAVVDDQFLGEAPVHVMAVRALQWALTIGSAGDRGVGPVVLPHRHVGPVVLLRHAHGMTRAAEIVLGRGPELGASRLRRLDRVARGAGDIAPLMLTALPEQALPPLVALQADRILFRRGLSGLRTEADVVGGIRLVLQVLAAGTVTGLAVVLLKFGPALVTKHPTVERGVHLLELILMTALARLAPDIGRPGDGRRPSPRDLRPQEEGHDRQGSDHTQQSPKAPWAPPVRTCRRDKCFGFHLIFLQSMENPIRQPAFSQTLLL